MSTKRYAKSNILRITLIIALLSIIQTDTPADCRVPDIIGEWTFYIDELSFTPSFNEKEKISCGNGIPNQIKSASIDSERDEIKSKDKKIILTLNDDYSVSFENKKIGKYNLVYTQSIILEIKNPYDDLSSESEFFFHFKYEANSQKSSGYDSICNQTMKGWFIPNIENKASNWTCAVGDKTIINTDKTKEDNGKPFRIEDVIVDTDEEVYLTTSTSTTLSFPKNTKYENFSKIVDSINAKNLPWKAELSKEFVGLSLEEISYKTKITSSIDNLLDYKVLVDDVSENSFLKVRSLYSIRTQTKNYYSPTEFVFADLAVKKEQDSDKVTDFDEISKYFNTTNDKIDINSLPLNWDWSNVGGKNFIPKVEAQGNCGSCYIMTTIDMLNSRLWIKTNLQDKTRFSKSHALSCNFYTEGCEGGFPLLIGKFFSEFELVPEQCFASYSGKQESSDKCNNITCEVNKRKYFVTDYDYIGGQYGNTTELDMVKELRARGPIPGNFFAPENLRLYYKSGIFTDNEKPSPNSGKWSIDNMNKKKSYYSEMNHSVLITGYGEDKDGNKYWILKNSWGKGWGDNGFFKVPRGENYFNIETQVEYLNIDYVDIEN